MPVQHESGGGQISSSKPWERLNPIPSKMGEFHVPCSLTPWLCPRKEPVMCLPMNLSQNPSKSMPHPPPQSPKLPELLPPSSAKFLVYPYFKSHVNILNLKLFSALFDFFFFFPPKSFSFLSTIIQVAARWWWAGELFLFVPGVWRGQPGDDDLFLHCFWPGFRQTPQFPSETSRDHFPFTSSGLKGRLLSKPRKFGELAPLLPFAFLNSSQVLKTLRRETEQEIWDILCSERAEN